MHKLCSGSFVQQTNGDQENSLTESLSHYTGIQLQNMPEDCLLEIFSYLSSDVMDLCSIAETCKRIQFITQRVIGKTVCFKGERYCSFKSGKFDHKTDKQNDIEAIFRNFGSCLSMVYVFGGKDEQRECLLFNLIAKYCKDALKSLFVLHLRISVALAINMKPVFKRLNTLSLSSVCIEGNQSTFAELDSLVELDLSRVKNCGVLLRNIFPKLERFTYLKNKVVTAEPCSDLEDQDKQTVETISVFIARHCALQSLDIDFECDQNCWMIILQTIGNSCTKLQKLTVGTGCDRQMFSSNLLRPLQTLKSLRNVKLSAVSFDGFQVFAPLAELRELELQHCPLPRTIDQFACLAQVTNLSLIGSDSMSEVLNMADIIRQLVNLVKFLALKMCLLDERTLSEIVGIVKDRSNVLTLICACESTVHCDEAFRKSNGHIVVRAEDRYLSTCSFR